MTNFVLDTNVISDLVNPRPRVEVLENLQLHEPDILYLCEPVDYEIRRGFIRRGATTRLKVYEQGIKKELIWIRLEEIDWLQAAQLWAQAVNAGKALADIDLLIASVAIRLDGVVVTADDDFDALPVRRSNWRK